MIILMQNNSKEFEYIENYRHSLGVTILLCDPAQYSKGRKKIFLRKTRF